MSIKDIKKQLKFSSELIELFNDFSVYLDIYFKVEKNIENNKELYEYYKNFSNNAIDLALKYKVIKK